MHAGIGEFGECIGFRISISRVSKVRVRVYVRVSFSGRITARIRISQRGVSEIACWVLDV